MDDGDDSLSRAEATREPKSAAHENAVDTRKRRADACMSIPLAECIARARAEGAAPWRGPNRAVQQASDADSHSLRRASSFSQHLEKTALAWILTIGCHWHPGDFELRN